MQLSMSSGTIRKQTFEINTTNEIDQCENVFSNFCDIL